MWDAGVLTDLGTLGGSSSLAYGINDVGQVVGYSWVEQQLRGFLWEDGQMIGLDPLPGDVATQAFGVNDAGDVVGSSTWYTVQFFSVSQATLWRDGGEEVIDLGYVPAPPWSCSANPYWPKSIARAVNNHGQVVGEAMCITSGAPKAAFLWQDGVMYNLNDLIPDGSGLDLRSALDINDAGQIVGYGITPGEEIHAFLLEPPRLPGDLNGDGVVDVGDFLVLLTVWGPCPDPCPPSCLGDLDADCAVGVTDFLILLANWS
jgi:probable HAF family extracellular repeat protein